MWLGFPRSTTCAANLTQSFSRRCIAVCMLRHGQEKLERKLVIHVVHVLRVLIVFVSTSAAEFEVKLYQACLYDCVLSSKITKYNTMHTYNFLTTEPLVSQKEIQARQEMLNWNVCMAPASCAHNSHAQHHTGYKLRFLAQLQTFGTQYKVLHLVTPNFWNWVCSCVWGMIIFTD